MNKTVEYLQEKKRRGEKISVLTCYDYPTAVWQEAAGVDIVLVGDSVGTNMLGYESERDVTMADMIHHLKAVRRGVVDAYLLGDLPYMSCETVDDALENARAFVSVGADGVKVEGFKEEIIRALCGDGIEVCAHLGFNPQINDKKGYKAKTAESAIELVNNALLLEKAGARMIVLETIPEEVALVASQKLSIPTIGIGAGRHTDGQVLVVTDLLGMNEFNFRHVKKYGDFRQRASLAFGSYIRDVERGDFPGEENAVHLKGEQLEHFESWAQIKK